MNRFAGAVAAIVTWMDSPAYSGSTCISQTTGRQINYNSSNSDRIRFRYILPGTLFLEFDNKMKLDD